MAWENTDELATARNIAAGLAGRQVPVQLTDDNSLAYTQGNTIHLHPTLTRSDPAVLCGTIAHELAHLRNRDGLRLTIQQAGTFAVAGTLSLAAMQLATTAGITTALLTALCGRLYGAAYERKRELAADRDAAALIDRAGGDGPPTVTAALCWGATHTHNPHKTHDRKLVTYIVDRCRQLDSSHPLLHTRLAALTTRRPQ